MPEPSIRALRIATVLNHINAARPITELTAPKVLRDSIKAAATDLNTESRRVHRDLVWALEYRGRGAQNRLAADLVDPAAPGFAERVRRRLPAVDSDYICATLDPSTTIVTSAPPKRRTASATSVWLDDQLQNHSLLPRLTRTVIKRYPVEEMDDVASMVGLLIAHWGANGSFDDHLAEGKAPSISRMAAWVGNRIKSALGRRGQDALWRQMRGSRTENEYRSGTPHPDSLKAESTYDIAYEGGDDDTPGSGTVVVVDPRPHEPDLDVDQVREALRNVIRASRPAAAKRYIRILEGMIAEDGKRELAASDGCSDLRASKLTQRVRADLREAAEITVTDARTILRYVVEEPFITHVEIAEDLNMEEAEVDKAIRLLHLSGYVTESDGRSYAATDEGRCVASANPEGGVAGRILI
jgi:hypothetical protein